MERVNGIEPSFEAWEAPVLPLNYTRERAADREFTVLTIQQSSTLGRGIVMVRIEDLVFPTNVQETSVMHGIPAESQSGAGAGQHGKVRYSVFLG